MHPTLLLLKDLHGHDTAIERLDAERARHESATRAASEAVSLAQRALDGIDAALQNSRERERELSSKLHSYELSRARALKILEGGVGDYEAAERQHETNTALIDETETAMLVLLEERDALEAGREVAVKELARVGQAHATRATDTESALVRIRAAVAEASVARDGVLALLERPDRERYDRLRARRAHAIAEIKDGTCSACHTVVPVQQVSDLKRGLIEPCRRCERWLVL